MKRLYLTPLLVRSRNTAEPCIVTCYSHFGWYHHVSTRPEINLRPSGFRFFHRNTSSHLDLVRDTLCQFFLPFAVVQVNLLANACHHPLIWGWRVNRTGHDAKVPEGSHSIDLTVWIRSNRNLKSAQGAKPMCIGSREMTPTSGGRTLCRA